MLYWVPVRFRSSTRPSILALPKLGCKKQVVSIRLDGRGRTNIRAVDVCDEVKKGEHRDETDVQLARIIRMSVLALILRIVDEPSTLLSCDARRRSSPRIRDLLEIDLARAPSGQPRRAPCRGWETRAPGSGQGRSGRPL